MDTNFFAESAMPPVAVVATVPAAKAILRRRHACLYSSNYGRGFGRALGVGVSLGPGVALLVGVAVAVGVTVGVGVGVGVGVAVAVAVGVGEGDPQPEPAVPFTPMEKSEGWPWKLAPGGTLLLKNAFMSLPHGVPTQLAPLVIESNERPVRSPIGVTLSQ